MALHSVAATRQIEKLAQASLPPHTLMQRAGLDVAKLALAIAPHAQHVWLACGPGNNGGDGLEAALHLKHLGKEPVVTWLGTPEQTPADARASFERAVQVGVTFSQNVPHRVDLCVDALLGMGGVLREPLGVMASWIDQMNGLTVPILAVDLPSGLDANTGACTQTHVKASHTLGLLTLKPGLFTAQGRDASGAVWFDDLQINSVLMSSEAPRAMLVAKPIETIRAHASHKGSFGDVAVVGGAPGMTGAALLAATAALHGGTGRVFVLLLDDLNLAVDMAQPELMFRAMDGFDFNDMTVVCGCGGGQAIQTHLDQIIRSSSVVVIDADAINSVAIDTSLQMLLTQRAQREAVTVLTPHPLEAARLLGCNVSQVQQDRLAAAEAMAHRFNCTVILKGSGTVIATPGKILAINPTGNARLACAGTGDVLAGMVGAKLAGGAPAYQAACEAVYQHGQLADHWPTASVLTASTLAVQPMPATHEL
jgi:hydroxyethylthiazole kinase-like uncharacterized protein yjeF